MMSYIRYLESALEPFARFADPSRRVPETLPITQGSSIARRQLYMRDCYLAADTLKNRPKVPLDLRRRIAHIVGQETTTTAECVQDILNEISSTVRGHNILDLIKRLLEVNNLAGKTLVIRSDKQTFQITSLYENDSTLTLRVDPID